MQNSKNIIAPRLEKFRQKLKEKDIDAALISKRENYLYMSGFTGSSAFLIVTQEDAVLITDFRYVEQASLQASLYEIVQYQGSLLVEMNNQLKKRNIGKLGFEDAYLTYDKYVEFKEKLDIKEFVPLGNMVEALRIIKDKEEIAIINKAVEIADSAFIHILDYIKPGVKEIEIAAEMEYFMKRKGASGASFEIIVASGIRSSMPHGVASEKELQQGDTITLDYGALYKDYCSDITRTVFLGKPDNEIKKIYGIVLEAQLKALEGAKTGLQGKEIDFIARDIISKAGHGKNFGHGLGHGVGLEIHEEPRLSLSGNVTMENGMAVTVEPGIYVNGFGGVRIEDVIVIHDDHPMVLTKASKEMIVL